MSTVREVLEEAKGKDCNYIRVSISRVRNRWGKFKTTDYLECVIKSEIRREVDNIPEKYLRQKVRGYYFRWEWNKRLVVIIDI